MSEPELLLDSNIRLWVVLPIVFITFFVGMIRHYVSILLQSDKRLTQEQVSDRSGPGTDALSALSHLLPFLSFPHGCRRGRSHRPSLLQPSPDSEQGPAGEWKIHPEAGTEVRGQLWSRGGTARRRGWAPRCPLPGGAAWLGTLQ